VPVSRLVSVASVEESLRALGANGETPLISLVRKSDTMEIPIPEDTEERVRLISQAFISPKHLIVFRMLSRNDSWSSVAQMVRRTKVSKRTVYRIINDFTKAGILDAQTVSRQRMYRLAEAVKWIATLLEEPRVVLSLPDVPERDRLERLIAQDKLAKQIVESLLQAPGALTLRQLSAEAGAWAIEVKSRLNLLIDEGLVIKRDLGYLLNRRIASEIVKEVKS